MELYWVILGFLLVIALIALYEHISWRRWKRNRLKGTKLERFLKD